MTGEHRKYKAIKTEPSNAFISSVDSFTSDDIKCAPDNDKLKTMKPLIIRNGGILCCVLLFDIHDRRAHGGRQGAG